MELTIPYTAKRLRKTLFMSLGYWIIFFLNLFGVNSATYWQVAFLLIAVFSTYVYFRERNLNYLTLKDGLLRRNDIWGRSIRLQEVTEMEKYAGDYILKSPGKKLRINTHIIPAEALKELDRVLSDQSLGFTTS